VYVQESAVRRGTPQENPLGRTKTADYDNKGGARERRPGALLLRRQRVVLRHHLDRLELLSHGHGRLATRQREQVVVVVQVSRRTRTCGDGGTENMDGL